MVARLPLRLRLAAWFIVAFAAHPAITGDSRAGDFDAAIAAFDEGDYAKSHELLLPLAERGQPRAELMLAAQYADGWGAPVDFYASMEWFDRGRAAATSADLDFVLRRWRAKAEAGDPIAQLALGTAYNSSTLGVRENKKAALEWIKRAADQGHPRGQYGLGSLYEFGDGVPRNMSKAMEYYQLAAAQGDASAQWAIGVMYYRGMGVKKDEAAAATWHRRAAERGNANGAYDLAYLYEAGKGVPRDPGEALKWYRVAAARGSPLAQNNLAAMYLRGTGGKQDLPQAYQFSLLAYSRVALVHPLQYQRAIVNMLMTAARSLSGEQKRAAMFELGVRCRDGDGVPRDRLRAYRWMSMSIRFEPDAERRDARTAIRDELVSQMHPDAVARARCNCGRDAQLSRMHIEPSMRAQCPDWVDHDLSRDVFVCGAAAVQGTSRR